jgi:hypothetical protein
VERDTNKSKRISPKAVISAAAKNENMTHSCLEASLQSSQAGDRGVSLSTITQEEEEGFVRLTHKHKSIPHQGVVQLFFVANFKNTDSIQLFSIALWLNASITGQHLKEGTPLMIAFCPDCSNILNSGCFLLL